MKIREGAAPERPPGQLWILRLAGNVTKQLLIASPAVQGFFSHWTGKRTVPCFEPREQCPGCQKGHPQRWHGFLHAYDEFDRQWVFLELTYGATAELRALLPQGLNLRGQRLKITRTKSIRGRLHVDLLAPSPNLASLPPELSAKNMLAKLWLVGDDEAERAWSNGATDRPRLLDGTG